MSRVRAPWVASLVCGVLLLLAPAGARADEPAGQAVPASTDAIPAQTAAPAAAPADAATTWILPDQISARLDSSWSRSRGAYVDRGGISVRANAMMMELHALAALAGHDGASRHDDRLSGLIQLFTRAPVLLYTTKIKRSRANFPHVPAWEAVYKADSSTAVLHPSADAIIARALAVAWRARDVAAVPLADSQAIQKAVGDVARGKWYRAPSRAENQINWNTDVYAADLEVNGDRSRLPDYRAHLAWLINHAFRQAYKGGSSNFSKGYGFRYLPQFKNGGANEVDTVEYANLVHSALGFYTTAVRAGMRPLNGKQISGLKAWSRHILFGTWTHGGYLNWDSGLGTSRRHLRQYWGFALDSLVRSAGPGALLGTAKERQYVRYIAEQGLELFRRTAWDGTGPLPGATSFDAPNGFPSGTKSALITPLRFAVISASLDIRLPATTPVQMGNMFSQDTEFGRLAISTPSYNTAVVKPVSQGEGGLEPTRLFDAHQRPLTVLGAGADLGGSAPGLRLQRGGSTVLEDQSGTRAKGRVPGLSVTKRFRNRSGSFSTLSAGATIRNGRASISVQHRFSRSAIETKYRLSRGTATSVTLRMPVWGQTSTIELLHGAKLKNKRIVRQSGALLVRGTTPDGGTMLVSFRGVPRNASIVVVRHGASPRAPRGTRELRVRFRASARMSLQRRIAVVSDAPFR